MSKAYSPGYEPGNYWFICDRCGFAYRIKEGRTTWDNLLVCEEDWEPRHAQDFIRGVPDNQAPRGQSRPEPTDTFEEVTQDGGPTAQDNDASVPDGTFNNSL